MLDLIELVFKLFTQPLEAIATIFTLGLIIAAISWFAKRYKSNLPLDQAPEIILRHRLKFADDDLELNRTGTISPRQYKRIRNGFLLYLIFYVALIGFLGFMIIPLFWDDIFRWGFDLMLVFLLSIMAIVFLMMIAVAAFHLRGYIKDLRRKQAVGLVSRIFFEEHHAEHLGLKLPTHQYKILANDSRLRQPLPLHIGFLSNAAWYEIQKLRNQSAILYIAPGTSKLLSFELIGTETDNQK